MPYYIDFSAVNISQAYNDIIQFILTSNYDINGCLTNCSNNGQCTLKMNISQYSCDCSEDFSVKSCKVKSTPYTQDPCLNYGTKKANANSTTFTCVCQNNYYGSHCEYEVNICANQTCSGNGYCLKKDNQPVCKCFSGYSGNDCDTTSNAIMFARAVKMSSVAICIGSIVFTAVIILANDVWNYFIPESIRRKKKKSENNKKTKKHTKRHYTKHFVYTNTSKEHI